ncbi:hypothetical protein Hanom_Chr07g00628621 [Helianthus anomalus]
MGEKTMEFENVNREFVAEQEAFNSKKKSLNWRVSNAEDKLAKEQKLIAERQRKWTAASVPAVGYWAPHSKGYLNLWHKL